MTLACIEHINLTVENPDRTAKQLCDLFDWKIRWSGAALANGYTVHVGTDTRYLALYGHPEASNEVNGTRYLQVGRVNHIGVTVANLNDMEQHVTAQGYASNNHRDYGGCRSFYFMLDDTLEIEVVMPLTS